MPRILSMPAAVKIEDQLERDIGKAAENAAKRYLTLYRRLLRKHNTRNHVITVEGGMGCYNIEINGKDLLDRAHYQYRATPVYELLHDIQDSFLSAWDYHLEGERLNPVRGKS